MSIWIILAILLGSSLSMMFLFWAWQARGGNPALVDVAWSYGTGACGVVLALNADGDLERRIVAAVLAGIWGLRLGTYLAIRLSHHPEDRRYTAMREKWGDRANIFMLGFFMLQALFVVLYGLPMLAGATGGSPFGPVGILGIVLIVSGMIGVTIADLQLLGFKTDSNREPNDVCRVGLWSWSRHPNYFFEWIIWCGWAVLSLSGSLWWLGIAGALCMLWFLFKVTGIPHVEREALKKRGDSYREYQRTTSVFIPRPPKKESAS
jgi:steroid 5-alpha reductase family enzyme